jgi:mono/diheme cytochrome c family protein
MRTTSCASPRPRHRLLDRTGGLAALLLLPSAALAGGIATLLALAGQPGSPASAPASAAAFASHDTTGVYTKAQAEAGKALYDVECLVCHGAREFTGSIFQRRWLTPPVSGLFAHVMNTMPQDAPGSLTPAETATLVAYLLELNGQPAGPEPLPVEMEKLARIRVLTADAPDA